MNIARLLRRTRWFVAAGLVAIACSTAAVTGPAAMAAQQRAAAPPSAGSAADADRPLVVVTTNILGDIVASVAGDTAEVVVLMPPGADPHSFGISAAAAARMMSADLLIANGLGLEEGVLANVAAAAAAGVPLIEVGEHVDPIPFGATAGRDEGHLDPHIWTDPERMIVAVGLIEAELMTVVPAVEREHLAASARAYLAELEMLTAEIEDGVALIPPERRRLITNHNVFGYFAERFGFEVIGTVLPSGTTLASPSAADLADLVQTIDAAGVPAIFADSSQSDRLMQVLADEADTHVVVLALYTESLGPPGSGADTYLGMMRTNVATITTALTG